LLTVLPTVSITRTLPSTGN